MFLKNVIRCVLKLSAALKHRSPSSCTGLYTAVSRSVLPCRKSNCCAYGFKSFSLTFKLVVLYTLSTLGILTALGLLFYSKIVRLGSHFSPDQLLYLRAECYDLFIVLVLVAALAALGFGYWVARKGLSRISEFESLVSQITASSLHQRIQIDEWPAELKQLGAKFNVMLDRLQASFEQLNQFSSDIAHELRTPVQNLMGVTELALSKARSQEEYQKNLMYSARRISAFV